MYNCIQKDIQHRITIEQGGLLAKMLLQGSVLRLGGLLNLGLLSRAHSGVHLMSLRRGDRLALFIFLFIFCQVWP